MQRSYLVGASLLGLVFIIGTLGCGDGGATKKGSKPSKKTASDNGKKDSATDGSAPATDGAASDIPKGEWGALKGKFVIDGDAPDRAKLNITKDIDFCGPKDLRDESVIVGDDGGIANVLVWVRTEDLEAHPDLAANDASAVSDNKDCRFQPHITLVRAGQTLEIKNSDPIGHNSLILFGANPQFNENIPIGDIKKVTPAKEERLPVSINCSIHPWMKGYLLIKETPYMTVSAEDGTFEIANLPTGVEIEFQVWQEKSGYVDEVSMGGKTTKWSRGRFTKVIAPGENDLGELRISADAFEK